MGSGRLKPKLFIILLFCALLGGCIGLKTSLHRQGLDYMNVKAYDQAVETLSRALAEKPGDPIIAADLALAKELAAKEHHSEGERLSTRKEVGGALIEFESAVKYQPGNQAYKERYDREKRKFDNLSKKIDFAYNLAMGRKKWDDSLKALQSMEIYESSFPDLSAKIEMVRKKAAGYHESLSDGELVRRKYGPAFTEIEHATSYLDDEKLILKKRARHHLLLSSRAWKDKRYLKAYEEITKGLEFEPDNKELKKYEKRLVDNWSDILYNRAVQAQNRGDLNRAGKYLKQIADLNPGYLNVEDLLSEIQGTLVAGQYREAEKYLDPENRSWVGTALANYLLVREEHSNKYPDIEEKIEQAKRLLTKEVEFRISFNFKNDSDEPGVAGYVKDQLLESLKTSGAVKNMVVLERENIDEILKEQGLGQAFLDETTAIQVKKIKGIQASISGNVRKVSVVESGKERPRYGSTKYVSGTRMIPNPDYARKQGEVASAQQRVLQAQQQYNSAKLQDTQTQATTPQAKPGSTAAMLGALTKVTSSIAVTGSKRKLDEAERDYSDAQVALAGTSTMVEEDVISDYRYKIYDLKLEGEVILSFKVIDYTTSEIGKTHTIRKTGSLQDTYIPGDPGKGVTPDPNDLPTVEEFKNKLLQKALEETLTTMKTELSRYSNKYYKKGLKAEENRLQKEAIENYVRYIYSAPDLSDNRVQHANDYVYEKMGLRLVRRKEG